MFMYLLYRWINHIADRDNEKAPPMESLAKHILGSFQ